MPRKGDFWVPEDDLEEAKEVFQERSPRSKELDKSARGPITTDIDVYANAQGRIMDYPGVDTPTETPRRGLLDAPAPGDFADLKTVDTETVTVMQERQTIDDAASEDVDRMESQARGLLNTILGP